MAALDISRMAFDPHKHYAGVQLQQGRVIIDDDWNDSQRITDENSRRLKVDIVGPGGSPDEGFHISNPRISSKGNIDFDISEGSFYLGGLILEMEHKGAYRTQKDWLNLPATHHAKPDLANPGDERLDIVYLQAWQQSVGAVEDHELLEVALGGPDTSGRIRNMQRVDLLADVPPEACRTVWEKFIEVTKARKEGIINTEYERIPDVKLTVSYLDLDNEDNLCSPSVIDGYLGAENQSIRVQLVDRDHITWGFDNASHLYRVEVIADENGNRNIVKLISEPKDQAHWPLAGQIVEILPWSAVLPNGEKVADTQGHLSRIGSSYNPKDRKIALTTPLDDRFGNHWTARPDKAELEKPSVYLFMRVWNRGADRTSEPKIKVTPGTPVSLGHTGLQVTLTGEDRVPGDHWILAARPETPNKIVPWELENGMAPQGVRYFFAPLALIRWRKEGENITGEVLRSCRRSFPHLIDVPTTFCTIAVAPGQDIHEALTEIIKKGGGCICLLPGNHILRKPIDLSNRSGIHFKGFGTVSRLYISTTLKGGAPFILSACSDISFDSFAVFNRTAKTVWSCQRTKNLSIENMIVSTTLVKGKQTIIAIAGNQCHQWCLENNVFSGPVIIGGTLLSNSSISGNVFQGAYRGIDLRYIQRSKIEGNRFSGLHRNLLVKHEFRIDDLMKRDDICLRHFANMTSGPFLPTKKVDIAPDYSGIDVSGIFETDIVDNYFEGSVGLDCEIVENAKIDSNDFITTVTGASCGLVHSLQFSENRIGLKSDGQNKEKDVQCRLGIAVLADAMNCRIVNNSFANVQEGLVFESDIGGKKAISRDFSVNLLGMKSVTQKMAKGAMAETQARIKARLDKKLLLHSTYFKIGKCEHILIQGNRFNASQTAIEWSGTKNIVDFRIVSNSFVGCQDVAIQIEPDDRVFFLADPVDTKVRLIEKNRFEVYSGAVRATISAVRIEKNDIRVKAPPMIFAPPNDFIIAAAENVYKLAPYTEAVKTNDAPMMRMAVTEAVNSIEKNPGGINKSGYSKTLESVILKKHAPMKGDFLADTALVMKTLADIGEINFIAPLLNTNIIKLQVSTEGFAVNLSGIQNRVVHNRIYSSNTQRPGGVLFHLISGEVRDNEVSVPGTALLMNGKLGVSAAYRGVDIVGNSLSATGIAGDKKAVYALAIPALSAGNISVANNQFKGSVMIGGDPISAQGFNKKEKFEVLDKVISYNTIKYDMPNYTMAIVSKAFPVEAGTFGQITPPVIVMAAWLMDPHADRPVVQFSNNRVIQGWVGIFQSLAGAHWSQSQLKKQRHKALVANLTGNVMDYGGSVVGCDVIIVGNQSQLALKYRAGREHETVANIPEAQSF